MRKTLSIILSSIILFVVSGCKNKTDNNECCTCKDCPQCEVCCSCDNPYLHK